MSNADIGQIVLSRTGIFDNHSCLGQDLIKAEEDEAAAERLGGSCYGLRPQVRMLELHNWLMHIADVSGNSHH